MSHHRYCTVYHTAMCTHRSGSINPKYSPHLELECAIQYRPTIYIRPPNTSTAKTCSRRLSVRSQSNQLLFECPELATLTRSLIFLLLKPFALTTVPIHCWRDRINGHSRRHIGGALGACIRPSNRHFPSALHSLSSRL